MKKSVLFFVFILPLALLPAGVSGTVGQDTPCIGGDSQMEGPEQAVRLVVRNTQGAELGEIVNFLVDTSIGKVAYALVDTGHAMAEEDLRLIPVNALVVVEDQIILQMTQQQMADAPAPAPGQTPEDYHRRLAEYYGVAPYWEE